ncbi:hypothetical protein Acr_03g0012870 [Actinidia rufa]|uniref:Uncharacterized protein n=1 Tax=Actinidia rufa TaxID=165716 RepID=A0A7J0EDG5_9ERIC|nr:hypothetical protein Acr_03g0012870 [Actinidia rufa]
MTDEVNQSPESPIKDSSIPEVDPLVAIHPSIRLPEEGEIIVSARPSEALCKKTLLRGYPSNVNGWKSKLFLVADDEWELPEGSSQEGVPRVLRTWGVQVGLNVCLSFLPLINVRRVNIPFSMSKKISLKKLSEKVEKLKNGGSSRGPTPSKGVVIGEKRPRDDHPSSPSKKGKAVDSPKGKKVAPVPEARKKTTRPADASPKASSSKPREGNSPSLGTVLGPIAFILGSPSIAEKILRGAIPPIDQEKALVIRSFLTVKNMEAGECASLQEGQAVSMESELKEAVDKARSSAVKEFKSSSDFLGAVQNAASKYFSEGFDFCKWKLRCHHPGLAINLENMDLDLDLLAEEDETAEEDREKNKGDAYLDYGDILNGDQDALSYYNEWAYLDCGDTLNGNQDTLSYWPSHVGSSFLAFGSLVDRVTFRKTSSALSLFSSKRSRLRLSSISLFSLLKFEVLKLGIPISTDDMLPYKIPSVLLGDFSERLSFYPFGEIVYGDD